MLVPGATLPEGRALEELLLELDSSYASWIERFTAGTVSVARNAEGGLVARVVPIGPTGLVLGPPRISGGRISREIRSGVLVAARGGEIAISLEQAERGVVAAVEVEGFRSRLAWLGRFGRFLYLRAQVVVHRRLSRAFLNVEVAPRLGARSRASEPLPARERPALEGARAGT